MKIKTFPKTRDEPKKRILLIPILLLFGGLGLAWLHPTLQFIGSILALTGVLTVFLVGMVFADLWAASRRTKDIFKAREKRDEEHENASEDDYDPFTDELDEA